MKKYRTIINTRILCDKEALEALEELESRGYLVNGYLSYQIEDEEAVEELLGKIPKSVIILIDCDNIK